MDRLGLWGEVEAAYRHDVEAFEPPDRSETKEPAVLFLITALTHT